MMLPLQHNQLEVLGPLRASTEPHPHAALRALDWLQQRPETGQARGDAVHAQQPHGQWSGEIPILLNTSACLPGTITAISFETVMKHWEASLIYLHVGYECSPHCTIKWCLRNVLELECTGLFCACCLNYLSFMIKYFLILLVYALPWILNDCAVCHPMCLRRWCVNLPMSVFHASLMSCKNDCPPMPAVPARLPRVL